MRVVKTSEAIEVTNGGRFPRRRIVVLERSDGHFSFAEEYYFVTEWEGEVIAEGWQRHPSEGIFASAEIAEAEGRALFAARHRPTN